MGFTGEPSLAASIKALHLCTAKSRHIALHLVAELVLEVSQVPITLREFMEQSGIKR